MMLIVEDDVRFARTLLEVAHERGFKAIVALQGDAGLALARKFQPARDHAGHVSARTWTAGACSTRSSTTQHPPHPGACHLPRSIERRASAGVGAIAHLAKPLTSESLAHVFDTLIEFVDRKMKNLLVVEDNDVQRIAITELIGNGDVHTDSRRTGAEALARAAGGAVRLRRRRPGPAGHERLRADRAHQGGERPARHRRASSTPARTSPARRAPSCASWPRRSTVKDAKSPERLLDETALFLHRVEANLPESKRKMIRDVHRIDPMLEGKTRADRRRRLDATSSPWPARWSATRW